MQNKIDELYSGIQKGDRTLLSRAITYCESTKPEHKEISFALISKILPMTGKAIRLGISGTPGVGKSTFIEAIGKFALSQGKKVAVLAVDPSSTVSGGSILGDKTRMNTLSTSENSYVRPSPSGGALGGLTNKTRESMLLCEAAGFDFIILETVGVGQSETAVSKMCDVFLLLLQSGAGDELQGIKRGILELVDLVSINKADGDNLIKSKIAQNELSNALMILRGTEETIPKVFLSSALNETGIPELYQAVIDFVSDTKKINDKREKQKLSWFKENITYEVIENLIKNNKNINAIENDLKNNKISIMEAVSKSLKHLKIK